MNSVVEDLKRLRRLFKRKQWTKGHFGVTASGKYLGSWDEVPRSDVAGMCLVGGVGYVSRSFRPFIQLRTPQRFAWLGA